MDYYKAKGNELIFHYCPSESFHSICQTRTIRLSDLFSTNDGLEVHWGYSIWLEVANDLLFELGHEFIDEIDKVLHGFGLHSLIISTSFSFHGDILSQWRAYSNDGKGFCIGFRAKDIFSLPVYPVKIIYNKKAQVKKVSNSLRFIHSVESSKKDKFGKEFFELCFYFATDLASMKNPAFEEEKAIRILHLLSFEQVNKSARIVDRGGTMFGMKCNGQEIKYRFRDNSPIAYQDYNFTNGDKVNPIKKVVLGPKNRSLITGISIYLETLGIQNVEIVHSKASYV